jgi:hypothetical protein
MAPNGPVSLEAKQRSQRPGIGWVTKIYYLELLRASEGTLSRWSRLHLLLLTPTSASRRVEIRYAAGRKTIAESLSQHDEKHLVPAYHLPRLQYFSQLSYIGKM